ncbi:hypothetical protein SISSUDRAFT_983406 [Sistotremastrum suecicum HHB10207 ss-3]|uniref:Uncharacterized protein n=1 Tax=Sistotremastrum suecicum HHB10207 ss-3 TaxID=1314776 RepID=A0A166F863_9AGAM|nr:hypothetical protein SISSUDRAFT_983406 [Sistotremastrum suecicum HHB10207 ss-3]
MRINVTVPNWSPALSYTPQLLWSEGNETDASLSNFIQDLYKFGYHSTTLNGPSMVFNFNGTGVWIFGGFRPSLGPYNVKLDNSTFSNPGFGAGDSESFQAVLFGKGDMDCAPHQLILYNNAAPNNSQAVLDVDYVRESACNIWVSF